MLYGGVSWWMKSSHQLGPVRVEPLVQGEAGQPRADLPGRTRGREESVRVVAHAGSSQSAIRTPKSGTKNEPSRNRNAW